MFKRFELDLDAYTGTLLLYPLEFPIASSKSQPSGKIR